MAQNLFEKYGIKEVADVTLYRIERKDETYESQRKISISSILKGALTKQLVYPLDEDGKGENDGYEAYVFKDADVLTHFNYDCDDVVTVKGTALFVDRDSIYKGEELTEKDLGKKVTSTEIEKFLLDDTAEFGAIADNEVPNLFEASNVTIRSLIDTSSNNSVRDRIANWLLNGYTFTLGDASSVKITGVKFNGKIGENEVVEDEATVTYRSFFVKPMHFDNATAKDLQDYINENHQGEFKFKTGSGSNEADIESAYIDIMAPIDATGDEIRAAFKVTQEKIYDSLGVMTRFTQPVRISKADEKAKAEGKTGGKDADSGSTLTTDDRLNKFLVTFEATLSQSSEAETGRYDLHIGAAEGHYHMDKDREIGTHEFSYAEQVCMLFAKNQNLITRAGTRYQFEDANSMFGSFEFDDNFATAPNGKERIVVVGLVGRTSENLYDLEEVNDAIKELTDTIEAKAYDITYSDYAELVVEDEMGYYLPQQLGYALDKKTKAVSFFDADNTYDDWAKKFRGIDFGIHSAINTWGDDQHYSINDAIDALKQQAKIVDTSADFMNTGYDRVFGGYKVTGKATDKSEKLPLDDDGRGLMYEDYTLNGVSLNDIVTGKKLSSSYTLEGVLQALANADMGAQVGQVRITSTAEMESNRAIYVGEDNAILGNSAFIYLLKNVNNRGLANDHDGIFELRDKKGNKLFYQDKVFAGTAYLALVVIGNMGLIFVVDRHCTKNTTQVAWMVNDNGYITDKQAERIVKNGLIHTATITACDESFDATCTVGSIKVRKTKKNVLRYVPVLFLDSLKVSTISQASETTDATGGRGNAKLITWDYGKDITLEIEDALYTPASMSAIWAGEHGDLKGGVKDTHMIDRFEKIVAKRSFIVPAGNQEGTPTEGNVTAQAVYYDPKTMEPFQDGTPIAEGELIYKFTRSVAYDGNSIGNTIEISADKFPGTYRIVGETMVRDKKTGEDQRFQFIIPEAKMTATDTSVTLEADGDPVVFSFSMSVLRPDDGVMMKFVQFDVEENEEENDGSTMVKDTENLNLLDDAEMYKVSGSEDEEMVIGATEY